MFAANTCRQSMLTGTDKDAFLATALKQQRVEWADERDHKQGAEMQLDTLKRLQRRLTGPVGVQRIVWAGIAIVGLSMTGGVAYATPPEPTEPNPIGECVMSFAKKYAPTEETAVRLAEYIADRCMELRPPPECDNGGEDSYTFGTPAYVQRRSCLDMYQRREASVRTIVRDTAYEMVVMFRRHAK